jgi:hypothetical protein
VAGGKHGEGEQPTTILASGHVTLDLLLDEHSVDDVGQATQSFPNSIRPGATEPVAQWYREALFPPDVQGWRQPTLGQAALDATGFISVALPN